MSYIEITKEVEIEVSLDDFEFDEIVAYVSKQTGTAGGGDDFYTPQQLHDALFVGEEEKALDMLATNLGVIRVYKEKPPERVNLGH